MCVWKNMVKRRVLYLVFFPLYFTWLSLTFLWQKKERSRMPLTMNVHNSPPPFLFLPFPNWGGAAEIGRPFVKIRETAIMWRIAYLRERISWETCKIALVYYICHCFPCKFWYVGTQKVHIDFILWRFSPVGHFSLDLRVFCGYLFNLIVMKMKI